MPAVIIAVYLNFDCELNFELLRAMQLTHYSILQIRNRWCVKTRTQYGTRYDANRNVCCRRLTMLHASIQSVVSSLFCVVVGRRVEKIISSASQQDTFYPWTFSHEIIASAQESIGIEICGSLNMIGRKLLVKVFILAQCMLGYDAFGLGPSSTVALSQLNSQRLTYTLHACSDNEAGVEAVEGNMSQHATAAFVKKSFIAFTLACTLFFSPAVELLPGSPPIIQSSMALAADYGSLSDEQKAVAEAWRIVDNNFIDRTFNNQDWWKMRQDIVKKKYKNMDEAQIEIEKMVGSLGDKYTRYLPPSKYRSIVDSATGTLAGVGVEISSDKETGKIFVSDTEPSSPASMGGIRKGDVFLEVSGARFDDGKSTPDDVASKLRGPEGSRGECQ